MTSANPLLRRSERQYAVRMGMSVAQAEELADILLRCPQDVAERVHDQLWLRTLFVIQRKRTRNGERPLFVEVQW